jgi:inorganic pyrophosphatase/exopolyphosphatase
LRPTYARCTLNLATTPEDGAIAKRAFGRRSDASGLDLQGIVSRKQQFVPPLAAALAG